MPSADAPIPFNAWRDAWIPVLEGEVSRLVSLRELFAEAHRLTALGAGLSPLDRDSLHRLLVSIAAVIGRLTPKHEWPGEDTFSSAAITRFEELHIHRFNLTGAEPFLQRWDRSQDELEALQEAAAGKPVKGLLPIEQLAPEEPGGSSSKWALPQHTRSNGTPEITTLLLVTAWFQTKNGNGQDPWGGRATKGSAGTWHTNPMAVWWTDPSSLARTLWANVPEAWLEPSAAADLPLFLDHHSAGLPPTFAANAKTSVTRFTYARTLPLLVAAGDRFTGFVMGADESIPLPPPGLGKDDKERLGRVHEHDHTRLYTDKNVTKPTGVLVPRGSFGTRLSSTEGFAQWFRAERGLRSALRRWYDLERVHSVADDERVRWRLSVLSETTDGKGSREWAAWDSLPAMFAGLEAAAWDATSALLDLAGRCRWAFVPAGRTASGESKDAPLVVTGQTALYASVQPVLLAFINALHHGDLPDPRVAAEQIVREAITCFAATTDPLLTPRSVSEVARARAEFARLTHSALNKSFPRPHVQETA